MLPTPVFWPGEFHGLCGPWGLFIYLAVLGLHRWVGFSLAEAPGLLIALFIVCFPS